MVPVEAAAPAGGPVQQPGCWAGSVTSADGQYRWATGCVRERSRGWSHARHDREPLRVPVAPGRGADDDRELRADCDRGEDVGGAGDHDQPRTFAKSGTGRFERNVGATL